MAKRASVKGRGADIFFGGEPAPLAADPPATPAAEQPSAVTSAPAPIRPLRSPPARQQVSEHASSRASMLAPVPDEVIATIRQAVKVVGKEVSFVRLTPEEKAQVADIVYTYKRQGKKMTENEINRIAVNYIVQDYKVNGEQSVLARVIAALLA